MNLGSLPHGSPDRGTPGGRDHPALNLLNSVYVVKGETIDLLADGTTMRQWLHTSGVPTLPDLLTLTPPQLDNLARDTRRLREELRAFLTQRIVEKDLSRQDVTFINRRLARTKSVQVLVARDGRWQMETHPDPTSQSAITSELAAVCADFVANIARSKVRKCAHPTCTLWFTDSNRGAARRWCSMATCGHRTKLAALNQRRQAGESAGSLGALVERPDGGA
jgi:predicted RNA-binding Zn ribbon-like protein